jgi:hypothetical protein
MARFEIISCSIDDGPAIAKANISAFWRDPTWVVIWPGKTLEYVIAQYSRRMPYTLLLDRAHRRHQMVVDTETGVIVGYTRWTLPELDGLDMETFWPMARVPGVTQNQEREAEAEYSAADYAFDRSLDELDRPLDDIMDRLTRQKKHVGKYC